MLDCCVDRLADEDGSLDDADSIVIKVGSAPDSSPNRFNLFGLQSEDDQTLMTIESASS